MTSDDIGDRDRPGTRARLPGVLVVLATVTLVLSATTTWVRTEALNTDQWVKVSSELLEEPTIREALAAFLVEELYAEVDVAGELEDRLPEELSGLAGPIAGALRGPATDGVERILSSDQFASLWAEANRVAHQTLLAILLDETRPGISTDSGTVTLDLAEAVKATGERLGISEQTLGRIPPDAGRITVFQASELADAQTAVRVLHFLSWFLFVVVVGLYTLAVVLARGRRREMLRNVGLGLVVGGVVLLLVRVLALRTAVDVLVQDPSNRPIATLTGEVLTELLRQIAWSGIVYGVLIVAFAALLGHQSQAVALRRLAGRWMPSNGAIAVGTFLVLLMLLVASPGRAFDRWTTALTLVLLLVGAVVTFVRVVRAEYPVDTRDDTPDPVAEPQPTATATATAKGDSASPEAEGPEGGASRRP